MLTPDVIAAFNRLAAIPQPDAIYIGPRNYRALTKITASSQARDEARRQGFNWRKVKRLARKAAERAG